MRKVGLGGGALGRGVRGQGGGRGRKEERRQKLLLCYRDVWTHVLFPSPTRARRTGGRWVRARSEAAARAPGRPLGLCRTDTAVPHMCACMCVHGRACLRGCLWVLE